MDVVRKLARSLLIGTVMGVIVVLITSNFVPGLIDRLEHQSYYMRYYWKYAELKKETGRKAELKDESSIYIIDIDDRSQHKMGVYWNWNRSYHAELIRSLTNHFPAALFFDINFLDPEDENYKKRFSTLFDRAQSLDPEFTLPERSREALLNSVDYDRQFIEATAAGRVVYHGVRMSSENDYPDVGLSLIKERSTLEWHQNLHPSSCFEVDSVDFDAINHDKTIIDGIFPQLAQVSAGIGHLNMIPNDDGVIREVDLLYSFGPHKPIYMPASMRVAASLFATPNNEIVFKPGRSIDLGSPFKIFKDSSGNISFSYPNTTRSQIDLLISRAEDIRALQPGRSVRISSLLVAGIDADGARYISSYYGQIPGEVVDALLANGSFNWDALAEGDSGKPLADQILVRRDSEMEWLLTAPYGDGEWYLTRHDIETIQRFSSAEFNTLKPGEKRLVFYNLTVENRDGALISSIPVLRGETLKQLCRLRQADFENLAPGMRIDVGPAIRIPLTPDNRHIVTYFGKKGVPFKYYSYYDIMKGRAQGDLEGKIFIVGSSVTGLFDIVNVPISNTYPGVEVHASLINSFITNSFVTRLKQWQDLAILLLAGIITGVLSFLLKPLLSSILSCVFIFVYFLVAMTLFGADNVWIEIVRPILTILATYTAVMAYRYITEEKDRKFLQSTFKTYLSPELIDIMYKTKQIPQLGGEEGVRTAYFTDIQSFSTFSEKLGSPTRLVELLNEYLSAMTDILLKHYGTLDKYEGDAIIAFFGAPMPMADHARQACLTALDMQKRLGDLRSKWNGEGDKWPDIVHGMRMRIGINTGAITTGNMGSNVRMNYTMMGDAVNLAARLESAAKQYGVYTMISHFTHDQIKESFETRQLDKITVVGKSEPVVIHELIGEKGTLTPEIQKLTSLYREGLNYFYTQQWDKAVEVLTESEALEPNRAFTSNNISPSRKIIQYCEMFKAAPPGRDWDGVIKLTSK